MKVAKIGVVGGGIFGATAAIRLARSGHHVTLFEKQKRLLAAASGINQYRLHRGYHYPRSLATAIECRHGEPEFRREYADAVLDGFEHFYAFAREGSLVTPDAYFAFLKRAELEHEEVQLPCVNSNSVSLVLRAREALFDPDALRTIVERRLRESGVHVRLGQEAVAGAELDAFDFVIVASYAALNQLLPVAAQRSYQFEVCEKLVVRLPAHLRDLSIVVMDGPFFCVDPFARTGMSVMGNVVHALHATNDGVAPIVPAALQPYVNAGVVPPPPETRFAKFVETAAHFIPELAHIEHVGSMFTIRTVLPNVHATDERRTSVNRVSERLITLFSGKIDSCVAAADAVAAIVEQS